jgi:hypothetical protein
MDKILAADSSAGASSKVRYTLLSVSQSSFFSTSNMPISRRHEPALGEDADHARAAPDFQIQPLQRIGRADPHAMWL